MSGQVSSDGPSRPPGAAEYGPAPGAEPPPPPPSTAKSANRADGDGFETVLSHSFSGPEGTATAEVSVLPPPSNSGESVNSVMMKLSLKIKISGAKAQDLTLVVKGKEVDMLNKKALVDMEKQIEDMAKAKKAGLFGKIFGWIAIAATAVASLGNPALVAVAALGVGMMVASETGLMDKLAEKIGANGAMALMIGVTLLMTVASGGAALMNGVKNLSAGLNMVKAGAGAVSGVSGVASSASSIVSAEHQHDVEMSRAESKRREAKMEKARAEMEEAFELLLDSLAVSDRNVQKVIAMSNATRVANDEIAINYA